MSAPITHTLTWRSIQITISYHPNRWNSGFDHIEVQSLGREPLPITETGYRSHFALVGTVTDETCVQAVVDWLDEASQSKDWVRKQADARQMRLF